MPVTTGFANVAAMSATVDLISLFFQHQANQFAASRGIPPAPAPGAPPLAFADASANDPLAAYAATKPQAAVAASPRNRTWVEGYGSVAHTGAQGAFTGDRRRALGGIGGIGVTVVPGVNLAFTVDQGNTKVEVNSLPQGSLMDVTQLGGMASFDSGPWTLGVAGVYGFGHIRSSRFDTGGEAVASYGTKMWGVITEASYYWQIQSFRVVPKAGFDHTHVSVDSYEEFGGAVPVFGTAQTTDRSRVYGALELGYTVQPATAVYDFSVYGKLYDIVSQRVTPVVASAVVGGFTPVTVPAAIDERLEYATGASVSVRVAAARLYLNYDGRFRRSFDSHGGTVGLEVRW